MPGSENADICDTRRELVGLGELKNSPQAKADFEKYAVKLKDQEASYKDFCRQTKLTPQNERLRVYEYNKSLSQKAVWADKKAQKIEINYQKYVTMITSSGNPRKITGLPPETLRYTTNVDFPNIQSVVPKYVNLTDVTLLGGKGTSIPIRDVKRLITVYENCSDMAQWEKKAAICYGDNYRYEIHWYEYMGKSYADEYKTKGVKKL